MLKKQFMLYRMNPKNSINKLIFSIRDKIKVNIIFHRMEDRLNRRVLIKQKQRRVRKLQIRNSNKDRIAILALKVQEVIKVSQFKIAAQLNNSTKLKNKVIKIILKYPTNIKKFKIFNKKSKR